MKTYTLHEAAETGWMHFPDFIPAEGQEVLVAVSRNYIKEVGGRYWKIERSMFKDGEFLDFSSPCHSTYQAIYWMPLPEPPPVYPPKQDDSE